MTNTQISIAQLFDQACEYELVTNKSCTYDNDTNCMMIEGNLPGHVFQFYIWETIIAYYLESTIHKQEIAHNCVTGYDELEEKDEDLLHKLIKDLQINWLF